MHSTTNWTVSSEQAPPAKEKSVKKGWIVKCEGDRIAGDTYRELHNALRIAERIAQNNLGKKVQIYELVSECVCENPAVKWKDVE